MCATLICCRAMGLLAGPLDAVPLVLSWPAVVQGWYLQGSALLSRQEAERQVPPGRGFKTSQVDRVRQRQLRLNLDGEDPAFGQFLRRMEAGSDDDEDNDGEEQQQ